MAARRKTVQSVRKGQTYIRNWFKFKSSYVDEYAYAKHVWHDGKEWRVTIREEDTRDDTDTPLELFATLWAQTDDSEINAFGAESLTHITDENWMRFLADPATAVTQLVKLKHSVPQNRNMRIPRAKWMEVMVLDGGVRRWKVVSKGDILDTLVMSNAQLLHEKAMNTNVGGSYSKWYEELLRSQELLHSQNKHASNIYETQLLELHEFLMQSTMYLEMFEVIDVSNAKKNGKITLREKGDISWKSEGGSGEKNGFEVTRHTLEFAYKRHTKELDVGATQQKRKVRRRNDGAEVQMMNHMDIKKLLANDEAQQTEIIATFNNTKRAWRPNRVRTFADSTLNRRIGKQFTRRLFQHKSTGEDPVYITKAGPDHFELSNNRPVKRSDLAKTYEELPPSDTFTFVRAYKNGKECLVTMQDKSGKEFAVTKKTLGVAYRPAGDLQAIQHRNKMAKYYQRVRKRILRNHKNDFVETLLKKRDPNGGNQFNILNGKLHTLKNHVIQEIIAGAMLNPQRGSRAALDLTSALKKGIRTTLTNEVPTGGRMLGIGNATGDQASRYLNPLSLVDQYYGGRRRANARFIYTPANANVWSRPDVPQTWEPFENQGKQRYRRKDTKQVALRAGNKPIATPAALAAMLQEHGTPNEKKWATMFQVKQSEKEWNKHARAIRTETVAMPRPPSISQRKGHVKSDNVSSIRNLMNQAQHVPDVPETWERFTSQGKQRYRRKNNGQVALRSGNKPIATPRALAAMLEAHGSPSEKKWATLFQLKHSEKDWEKHATAIRTAMAAKPRPDNFKLSFEKKHETNKLRPQERSIIPMLKTRPLRPSKLPLDSQRPVKQGPPPVTPKSPSFVKQRPANPPRIAVETRASRRLNSEATQAAAIAHPDSWVILRTGKDGRCGLHAVSQVVRRRNITLKADDEFVKSIKEYYGHANLSHPIDQLVKTGNFMASNATNPFLYKEFIVDKVVWVTHVIVLKEGEMKQAVAEGLVTTEMLTEAARAQHWKQPFIDAITNGTAAVFIQQLHPTPHWVAAIPAKHYYE